MKKGRFLISVIAIFIFALLWNSLVHMVVLKNANMALLKFARPAEERNLVLGLALTLGIAIAFVWTFRQWAKHAGLKQGLLHGVVFAVLAGLFVDLNQHLIYPLPASLAAKWFVFGVLEFLCYGVIVSVVYREKRAA